MLFSVPIDPGSVYYQHVMNTLTGAWCRWTDLLANCWCYYNGSLYFGSSNGKVNKLDPSLYTDGGAAIESHLQTAWIQAPMNMSFVGIREYYRTNADVVHSNEFATDFANFDSHEYPIPISSSGLEWGFDWGSPWGGNYQVYHEWNVIRAFGKYVSMDKKLSTKQDVKYLGSTWLAEASEAL